MTTPDSEFRTDRKALATRLAMILPAHCLLVDEEDLRPYECDGLTAYREGVVLGTPLKFVLDYAGAPAVDAMAARQRYISCSTFTSFPGWLQKNRADPCKSNAISYPNWR